MQAREVRYHEPFDCRLDTIELPELGDNEIRCHSLYSVISAGSECISFRRQFDPTMHRCSELGHPAGVGYSMSAEVIAIGKKVTDYAVGDLIYAQQHHQEYFNIEPGVGTTKLPPYIKPNQACWLTILRCGLFAAQKCRIKVTDYVVIAGLGVFGMSALQFAKLMGARKVIAVDPIRQRTDRALRFGADAVITKRIHDCQAEIVALCGGEDPDCVIDCTNKSDTLAVCCDVCRHDGQVSVIADPPDVLSQAISSQTLRKYTNIHGMFIDMMREKVNFNYPCTTQRVHETIFEFIRDGKINVDDMITKYIDPADCNENYQAMFDDRSEELGVLYDWRRLEKRPL